MEAPEILLNAVFYVLALGAAAGAVAVATSRNIVRSAFALLVVLFSMAGLYAVMKSDFIAATQVLVYVGGILVLIIFAVMLTHKITDVKLSNDATPGPAALCACLCLLFSLVVVVLSAGRWRKGPEETDAKAGSQSVKLAMFQLDGRTAIARGGATFEPALVLSMRLEGPVAEAPTLAEFVLQPEGGAPAQRKTVPVDGKAATAEFRGLPSGGARWSVVLRGASGPIGPPAPAGGDPDVVIHPGTTGLVARGLATRHLFSFEVVSVLLLAALVGAAFLARKEVRT
jgi:NADH:ubiquinone oxidoreductase subunit 6 (subunit J)